MADRKNEAEIYYLDSSLIKETVERLNLDIDNLHCKICDSKLNLKNIGGFMHGSVEPICNNQECKIVARMNELVLEK
jgi:hypothetical protein